MVGCFVDYCFIVLRSCTSRSECYDRTNCSFFEKALDAMAHVFRSNGFRRDVSDESKTWPAFRFEPKPHDIVGWEPAGDGVDLANGTVIDRENQFGLCDCPGWACAPGGSCSLIEFKRAVENRCDFFACQSDDGGRLIEVGRLDGIVVHGVCLLGCCLVSVEENVLYPETLNSCRRHPLKGRNRLSKPSVAHTSEWSSLHVSSRKKLHSPPTIQPNMDTANSSAISFLILT